MFRCGRAECQKKLGGVRRKESVPFGSIFALAANGSTNLKRKPSRRGPDRRDELMQLSRTGLTFPLLLNYSHCFALITEKSDKVLEERKLTARQLFSHFWPGRLLSPSHSGRLHISPVSLSSRSLFVPEQCESARINARPCRQWAP
ncbi:hypothetical protein CEXT_443831 [Caerostris extrusa]|uniref:Uncharacterized protein n=1 Tax=Caerostris extrusa TaxID=172846 RepID=A0AAV4N7Q3_CAEEX|nr:hypothetical protein CEXT_443831 [Caerostris extrusa]